MCRHAYRHVKEICLRRVCRHARACTYLYIYAYACANPHVNMQVDARACTTTCHACPGADAPNWLMAVPRHPIGSWQVLRVGTNPSATHTCTNVDAPRRDTRPYTRPYACAHKRTVILQRRTAQGRTLWHDAHTLVPDRTFLKNGEILPDS